MGFKNAHSCVSSVFSSVIQVFPTLCDPMNCSMPGLPIHHQLLEFTQTHVHWVSDVIQPSHPLSSPSPPAPNPSQHQSLYQWVNFLHEVAKVLICRAYHEKCWTGRNTAGIKIARRNINNLRYADDTTLIAESKDELKSLLMKWMRGVKKLA